MAITKAVLTGGGRATRLRPITTTINKHLIPLANKPMFFHAIEKVAEAGIKEIFINTNPGETQIQKIVGTGERWGVKIEYFEQEGGPQGIAHVVKCAQKFIGDDPFMFYLSDNIILGSLIPLVKKFEEEQLDCLLALSQVPDPERFGVPVFDTARKLIDVVEKPSSPPSNFAVTGIYLYNQNFFKAFDHIQKSDRGEYEISSIHSYFLKNGYNVGSQEITGWWKDTGKPNDLLLANQLLLDQMAHEQFVVECETSADFEFDHQVHVCKSSAIGKNVKIKGPVIIGENCVLENCTIGPYVTIGNGTVVKQATIKESIIFGNCTLDVPIEISQSIIGENARIVKNITRPEHRFIVGDYTSLEL